MAVIIYGTREYGRIDAHGGEHASTRFFHIWFAPLFPIGSSWFTGPNRAHPIKLHGKSIAATYLRIWGPLAALGCLSAALATRDAGIRFAPLIAAIAFGAASLWSWTWRSLRGAAALRRSDFNYVAFGTRCDPRRMLEAQRAEAKRDLDRRWAARAPERSPDEVATYGATDAAEAVLAYGLLRLGALDRPRSGAKDAQAAERILAGEFDAPDVTDGPYRAGPAVTGDAASQAALAELVAKRAAEAAHVHAPDRTVELRRQKRRSRMQAAGLVILSLSAVGGIMGVVAALEPTLDVGIRELRSVKPPKGRVVRVTCDTVEAPLWEETSDRGKTTARIAMCELGKYLVPVRFGADGALPEHVVVGTLAEINERQLWVREGLSRAPDVEARATDVYIDATHTDDMAFVAIGIGIAVLTPVLWVLWFRARRRRIATERALLHR